METVSTEAVLPAAHRVAHREPEQIGPYHILEKIGEGGMGIVYKAEQKHPVRRTVALKVIKLGMDTGEVIARFEQERQALALMSHPNVAKVYEAGATEQGRPYFAMELVAGDPLTHYCDEYRLTTRERLELFVQVCHAVQHAHQKGIIHRDLKPSNILVSLFDGKPVPKVIDFGIAKAANQALTERTLNTRHGSLIGTPEYMSPEQAMTSGLDVDTRTDIYSLGVVLYELLTGTLPFDPATLHECDVERMAQIIKTVEPPKPSTRLSMLDGQPFRPAAPGGAAAPAAGAAPGAHRSSRPSNLAEVASLRRCDPRSLRRELRGDLDWIVLKALEKDRTRRYETANGLANDVRRHLDNEPIAARPPTTRYRLSKFVSKHRVGVAAVAAVVLALGLGFSLAIYGLVQARRATRESNEAVQITGGLFTDDFQRQFDLAAQRLEKGWLADQPDAQAALRVALGTVGQAHVDRIEPKETRRQLTAALELLPKLTEPRRNEVAEAAHYLLGKLDDVDHHPDDARQEYEQANAAYEAAREYDKGHAANQSARPSTRHTFDTLRRLAELNAAGGKSGEARSWTEKLLRERVDYDQPIVKGSREWAVHNDQANRLARLGQYTDALAEWDRAVEVKPRDDAGWYYRGCLLAYLGDGDRYRENCREMAKRFANDRSFYVVEVTLKTCALRPDCDVPQERLRDMARQMDDPPDSGMNSWANLAKGMARYRLKEFDRCLAAMEESQKDGAREGRDAIASLFMAMADERLGHHQRARQTFAEVDEFVKAEPHPRLGNPDLTDDEQMSVEDWLILKVVHKEAAELLKGVSPGSTRP